MCLPYGCSDPTVKYHTTDVDIRVDGRCSTCWKACLTRCLLVCWCKSLACDLPPRLMTPPTPPPTARVHMAELWPSPEEKQMLPDLSHYCGRMAAVVRRAEEMRCFHHLSGQLTGCDHQAGTQRAPPPTHTHTHTPPSQSCTQKQHGC